MASTADDDLVSEISLDDQHSGPRHTGTYFHITEAWQRISLIWLDADKRPRIVSGDCIFKEGVGFFLSRAGSTSGAEKTFWDNFGEPRKRYATAIYVYPTLRGKIDVERFKTGLDVAVWDFAAPVFEKLLAAQREHGPLGEVDLRVRIVGPKKHFEVIVAGPSTWPKQATAWGLVRQRLEQVKPLVRPARALSTDEVASKLGIPSPFAAAEVCQEVDFDSLLDDSGSV
jgi:hypothetical protein